MYQKEASLRRSPSEDAWDGGAAAESSDTQQVEFDGWVDDIPQDTLVAAAVQPEDRRPNRATQASSGDVVGRGLLSMSTARRLVETFKSVLHFPYPMVHIPPSYSADQMRVEKPVLFLAVIAAASIMDQPDLSITLDNELLRTYADRTLLRSEKSLELIQALLISAAWYAPPMKFGQLKYYEYIHMAVTMSLEIGIGTRPAMEKRDRFAYRSTPDAHLHPAEDVTNPDLSMAPRSQFHHDAKASTEAKRTFLAVYCLAAGCSMSLRRPNMLRASSYLRECLEYMEASPDAVPSDRTLAAWVRLTMIGAEISEAFSFDDPANVASIADLKTQLMLNDFRRRLDDWESSVADPDLRPSMKILYYYTRMFLHEVALHVDHSPEDFQAPYQMGRLRPYNGAELPTKPLVESIAECIRSAHAMMDAYLSVDVQTARALPVLSTVRVSFATFVLAKLSVSAVGKNSRIACLMDRSSLKAETYLDRLIHHARDIVGPQGCRLPAILLALLFKVRQWCANPELIEQPALLLNSRAGDDEPNLHRQHPRAGPAVAIQGPRITELLSRSGDSPEMTHIAAGVRSSRRGGEDLRRSFPGVLEAVSVVRSQALPRDAGDGTSRVTSGNQTETTPDGAAPFAALSEQMELNSDFFSFLDDTNAYDAGGLTGLDDWGAVPGEISWTNDMTSAPNQHSAVESTGS